MKHYFIILFLFISITSVFSQSEKDSIQKVVECIEKEQGVYLVVDEMPEFPGGKDELLIFISKNMKYPAILNEACVLGRVICQFIIEIDGSISNIEVIKK